ncbi:AmpG family muropeptide MFS transporter [Sneathiella sp.]|uniref:AmpG family muropeptide MFS transporter n=1 Tax=Sneathiella sp. TaxID=1964365 RepID=UPI0026175425|nr:AmpG family muropeptide MFS transporter [Sneathiella sp.]MDF2367725.1 AmpG family muropeptide MFS transporter [Sneathiella sp.]
MTGWLSALSVYRDWRIVSITLLGFSSGAPLLMTGGILQAWLTQENIDLTAIGLFTLVGLPYTLKFLWAPIIDNIRIPVLSRLVGRRRSWLLLLQAFLITAILALAFSEPSDSLLYVTIAALAVAFASASYDIIVDAFRIEICDEKNMAAGAATYVYGYRIAMWLTGFSSLVIAQYFGWMISYMVMASFILIGTVTVLFTREPKTQMTKPEDESAPTANAYLDWLKTSIIDPFADFMKKPDWLVILLFAVLYKFGDALAGAMATPFYLQTGFTLIEIAEISKLLGTVATFGGLFIGGWLLAATTMYRTLWVCGLLQMLSNLMFAAQAAIGPDLAFLALTIGLENVASGMGTAVFVAYLSSLCNTAYTATQYALLTSLMAVARTVLVSPAGWLVERTGWIEFFILTTVAAVPGLALLWYLSYRQPIEQQEGAS